MNLNKTRRNILRKGFTLIELLLVVALIATIGGMAVISFHNVNRGMEASLITTELSVIRESLLIFKQDMGEAPQFIAELLQSPAPDAEDNMGGWWWREDGNYPVSDAFLPTLPDSSLFSYDPATRRGWSGPYLRAEVFSAADNELRETRINPDGAPNVSGTINSDSAVTPSKKMAILKSDYSNFPQKSDAGIKVSHYQFNFDDDSGEIAIRFLDDPTSSSPKIIGETRSGIKP